jgi:hypothetical protein
MTDRPEPLGLTVHSLPEPTLDASRQRTSRGRVLMLLILAACAAPVVASYFTYFVLRPGQGTGAYGTLIQPTASMPDVAATDAAGAGVRLRSLKGQWLLVTVGPAACDAACEKRLYAQRQLREMLGRERDRVDKVWLVTDAAPLRPELAAALSQGEPVRVLRMDAAALLAWLKPAAGATLEQHLYIVDPMGEWMMRMPVEPDPAKVKRDLERLLRASASWDRAGR